MLSSGGLFCQVLVYSVQRWFILSGGCLFCPERDAVERHPGFNPATRLTLSSSSGSSKKTAAATDDPELEEIEEILQECSSSPSEELSKPLPRPPASAKNKGGAKSAAADDDGSGGFNLFGFDAMEASASASGEQQVFFPPFLRIF